MSVQKMQRSGFAAALAAGLIAAGMATSAAADGHWPEKIMESCRALVKSGDGNGAVERDCYQMMTGVKEVLQIIGSDYYPVGKNAGFCMIPGTTPEQLAGALVTFADANPDCEKSAAMSGCLSAALKHSYEEGCSL